VPRESRRRTGSLHQWRRMTRLGELEVESRRSWGADGSSIRSRRCAEGNGGGSRREDGRRWVEVDKVGACQCERVPAVEVHAHRLARGARVEREDLAESSAVRVLDRRRARVGRNVGDGDDIGRLGRAEGEVGSVSRPSSVRSNRRACVVAERVVVLQSDRVHQHRRLAHIPE
jgi:hypothetical protein